MLLDSLRKFAILILVQLISSQCNAFIFPFTTTCTLRDENVFHCHSSRINSCRGAQNEHPRCLQISLTSTSGTDDELSTSLDDEAEQEIQEIVDLTLDFTHKIDETPVGSLEEEDFEFIQPILRELESLSKRGLGINGDRVLVAELMEKLVGRLIDEWQDAIINDVDINFEPEISYLNMVLNAWISVEDNENRAMVEERTHNLWDEIKDLYDSGLETCAPDIVSFNAMIRMICAKKGKGDSEELAVAMYKEMKEYGVMPNPETFEMLIEITTRSRAEDSAQRADDFMREGAAVFLYPVFGIDSFNAVISSWVKSNERDSSTKIERILALMDVYGVKPDVRSFTMYIDSFVQNTNWDSIKEGDNILSKLVDLYLVGELDFEPDVTCWTTVIRGWMRLSKRRKKAAYMAEEVLDRMIVLQDDNKITCKADAIVYSSVINAYVLAGLMSDAERILGTMEYLWQQGDEEMKPSIRVFTSLIEGWVKSPEEESMMKAETFLERVCQLHEKDCEKDVLSDIYRSLLFGYAKNNNPAKAENILRMMIEKNMKVNSFCFDKVIDGYTSFGDVEKIKNVYAVFELLESCQKEGILQANERVYTSTIRAIAKESKPGMAKKSQMIIRRMQQLDESGNEEVSPNIFTYNAMLKACSNSVVLDECERLSAFNFAIRTFNLLRSSDELSPDHVTYTHLIKCSHLLPEGSKRDNLITATTKQCVKDGMIDEVFLKVLEEYASEELSKAIFERLNY